MHQVKTILKDISKTVGIYRKRLWSSHKAYLTKEEFNNCVDKASLKKLAKMLRILGFLTQTKVYLFWKRRHLKEKCEKGESLNSNMLCAYLES